MGSKLEGGKKRDLAQQNDSRKGITDVSEKREPL